MHERVILSLGVNDGDRLAQMNRMMRGVSEMLHSPAFSSLMETEPIGTRDAQRPFFNRLATGEYELPPEQLLDECLALEQKLGRVRPYRFAPRTADIDIILFGHRTIRDSKLTIPHHALFQRRFLIEGCAQIAADMIEPTTGKPMRRLLEEMSEQLKRQRIHIIAE